MAYELVVVDGPSKVSCPANPLATGCERRRPITDKLDDSLGNANIAGLTADLKLSSNQFSLAINTYYCEFKTRISIAYLACPRLTLAESVTSCSPPCPQLSSLVRGHHFMFR